MDALVIFVAIQRVNGFPPSHYPLDCFVSLVGLLLVCLVRKLLPASLGPTSIVYILLLTLLLFLGIMVLGPTRPSHLLVTPLALQSQLELYIESCRL